MRHDIIEQRCRQVKKLLLGNEAVARGLYEAGCRVASSYPGTPSTEVTECAATYDEIYSEWAPNEKVAMETAAGAGAYGHIPSQLVLPEKRYGSEERGKIGQHDL